MNISLYNREKSIERSLIASMIIIQEVFFKILKLYRQCFKISKLQIKINQKVKNKPHLCLNTLNTPILVPTEVSAPGFLF